MSSKLGFRVACAVAAVGCSVMAFGVQANSAEKAQARQWLQDRLLSKTSPVFSFTYGGKAFGESLAGWKVTSTKKKGADGRLEYTTKFADPKTKLVVRCIATEFPGSSALDWVLRLENTGTEPTPIIENLLPMDVRLEAGAQKAIELEYGVGDRNSGESFAPQATKIAPGEERALGGAGGKSSNAWMPFFNLTNPDGNLAVAVGWSGQWQARFVRAADGALALKVGQEQTHFKLLPGESVRTPRVLVVHWEGDAPLRGNNLMRQVVLDRYVAKRDGKPVMPPMCGSVGVVAPDGSYEGPHLAVLPKFARLGVEVFWSDMDPQQWYPGGFPGGTGNWIVDKKLYPGGLEPLGDAIKKLGMEYLLWFEPERVQVGTWTQQQVPDFVFYFPNNGTGLFRLDMPEAEKWMFDLLDGYAKRLHLGWIRWDFNFDPLPYWRALDAEDRQGITEMKYIEGIYKLWDDLRASNPGLVIDQCAGGGRRNDIESMARGVPLWHSDMQCNGAQPAADQLQNGGLWRWVPLHGCGVFGLEPSYAFRSAMTGGDIMAVAEENDSPEAKARYEEGMKRTLAVFKKVRPLMLGDFYPLFPHLEAEDVWYGYQFHNEKLDAGCALIFRREQCADPRTSVSLRGVNPGTVYLVENQDTGVKTKMKGTELQKLTVEVAQKPGSALIFYSKAK
jgi:alpha-galactosidase